MPRGNSSTGAASIGVSENGKERGCSVFVTCPELPSLSVKNLFVVPKLVDQVPCLLDADAVMSCETASLIVLTARNLGSISTPVSVLSSPIGAAPSGYQLLARAEVPACAIRRMKKNYLLVRRSSKHREIVMSGRHNKLKHLSEPEIARFLEAAAALRLACCEPRIAASCEHAHALADLTQEIRQAIIKITGKEPEWVTR